MRVVAVTLAALALASAGAASPSSLASGLRFSRAGALVARVKTGPAGGYTVRMRPGVYTVTVLPFRVGMALTPRRVRVPESRLARIDFHLDTGIQ